MLNVIHMYIHVIITLHFACHFDADELILTNICVKKQDLVPMGTNSILQYGPPHQMGTFD